MDKETLNKIRVIRTDERFRTFDFPEEGWFVGASNSNIGPDGFIFNYLYNPKWIKQDRNGWGGYREIDIDEKPKDWWTFNSYLGEIETSYLYYCEDRETAKELCDFLNEHPTKYLGFLDVDIKQIESEIKHLQDKIKKLESYKEIDRELLNKAE